MYAWTRPRIAVPAHGEPLHCRARKVRPRRRAFLRSCEARNGTMVRLAPGPAAIIDDVPAGRLYKDGDIVIDSADRAIARAAQARLRGHRQRRHRHRARTARSPGDAIIDAMGLPAKTRNGELITDFIAGVVEDTLDGLPEGRSAGIPTQSRPP